MLADINRTLLLYLLIGVIIIAVLVIVCGTIIAIIKACKKGEHNKRKDILLTLLCIAIAAASWIFNMGWIRFIMTFLLIPFLVKIYSKIKEVKKHLYYALYHIFIILFTAA